MAAPRNSMEYYPLDTEACRSLTTKTRFILAALLERNDAGLAAATLLRNTPTFENTPMAPVLADYVPVEGDDRVAALAAANALRLAR
jgi:hypothetical protein